MFIMRLIFLYQIGFDVSCIKLVLTFSSCHDDEIHNATVILPFKVTRDIVL
jgi:hypothetical protein